VPTKNSDLARINTLMALKKNHRFLEVWCWNARVSLYLAKHNSESQIVWIEFSPLMYIISLLRVKNSRLKNIDILYWNALKLDLSSYDVIYVFWLPKTITQKIFPKLKIEMKKSARFYSYCFKMTNNYFTETRHKPSKEINSIYEYSHTSPNN
jgi:SAM-dependent methyltransferase